MVDSWPVLAEGWRSGKLDRATRKCCLCAPLRILATPARAFLHETSWSLRSMANQHTFDFGNTDRNTRLTQVVMMDEALEWRGDGNLGLRIGAETVDSDYT